MPEKSQKKVSLQYLPKPKQMRHIKRICKSFKKYVWFIPKITKVLRIVIRLIELPWFNQRRRKDLFKHMYGIIHLVPKYAKSFEKLTFLTPDTHTFVSGGNGTRSYQGVTSLFKKKSLCKTSVTLQLLKFISFWKLC